MEDFAISRSATRVLRTSIVSRNCLKPRHRSNVRLLVQPEMERVPSPLVDDENGSRLVSNIVMRSHCFKSVLRSLFVLCALLGFARVVLAQSGGFALTHVTIIDPGVGKPRQNMTILVRGHDIAAVGRAKQITIPTSAKVIDSTGRFVIPQTASGSICPSGSPPYKELRTDPSQDRAG
jgi:hypothetical protein